MRNCCLYLTVTGVVFLFCFGCRSGYHDRVIATKVSSGWTATYFFREPTSALDNNATYVSTRAAGTPDDTANHGGIVLELRGESNLELDWSDSNHLTITCSDCSRKNIDFQVIKVHNLEISYAGFADKQ